MKCSCKYNLGRERHLELVNLCFVAEIISVVITDKMVDVPIGVSYGLSTQTRMACIVTLVENGK